MRGWLYERRKYSLLLLLCLLASFCITGDASERAEYRDSARALPRSGQGDASKTTKAVQSSSSNIVLTVAVAGGGVTVRLYDEFGGLVEQTPPLTPPAVATLTAPGGSAIELAVPGGVFSGSAIVDIYMRGLPISRPIIDEADRRMMEQSAIPFGDLGPIEFVSTAQPSRTVTITLSYPSGSSPALLNSLKAYYLDKNQVSWIPVPSSRLDPEERTVAFDVSSFEVFRLMTGSADDLNGVIVYPNPFRPRSAKDHVLKFIGLTDRVEIKIFTLSGDIVWSRRLTYTGGGATWDGRNLEGKEVASGLYVYQITNARGEKSTGRISVIW
ncbi:MAG: T9SS type A sorting domain-containing protein [Candidatus Eiseniibacteriota bacterium]|nr:MAG: T9SS type A sorting domain-containing protein [Candidatus Eisenbacteria bacterium]